MVSTETDDAPPLIPDEPAKPQPLPEPATARAMVDLLRRHYITDERHPAWVFAPEIQAPDSARRADLICLGVSSATGGELAGHEVKVTRADVMAELADLTKCDPWMRYCDRWWLVVPHLSLIDGLEIPGTWGVLLPPSGRRTRSMTVHRKAPALKPAEQAPALRTLTSWQHWRLRDRDSTITDKDRRIETMRENQRRLEVHAPNNAGLTAVIRQIIDGLGGIEWGHEIGRYPHRVSPDEIITALRDLAATKHLRDQAAREITNARSVLAAMSKGADHLLQEIEEATAT